jgi:hypothetical protein
MSEEEEKKKSKFVTASINSSLILFRFLVSVSALDEKILLHGTADACIGR